MSTPNTINLDQAAATFAISNTPLFLLRRLRADAAVKEISTAWKPKDILKALKSAGKKKPQTLNDAVAPYVYLVALSFNDDVAFLRKAASIAVPHHRWYSYIAQVLIDTYRPTSRLAITPPPKLQIAEATTNSASATTILKP
jgi:hypothetical protein